MISGLIGLLLLLLILVIIWYCVKLAVEAFAPGLAPVFLQILGLVFLLIIVLSALQSLGAVPHWPWVR